MMLGFFNAPIRTRTKMIITKKKKKLTEADSKGKPIEIEAK